MNNENVVDKFKKLLRVQYPKEFIDGIIPVFCPRTREQRSEDKYDKDFEVVDRYTGIYAFGYQLLGLGGGEGLYRTINSLLLSNLDKNKEYLILDIGCGVGRTLYDCAELYPNSLFIGMDYAYNMVRRAKEILLGGGAIDIDLSERGLGKFTLKSKKLKNNVIIIQGSVLDLPFKSNIFDCVINTYLIDRVRDPEKALQQIISVLKPGGIFIFTDPLNFEVKRDWKTIPNRETVIKIIENQGIEIRNCFDGLIFRQIEDARQNYRDWMTLVVHGVKHKE
jgi:ubiquinone/menaquinone biosynthesis C-methylase UbiE